MYVAAEGFLVRERVRHGLTDEDYVSHNSWHAAPAKSLGTLGHQLQIGAAIDTEAFYRYSIVGI